MPWPRPPKEIVSAHKVDGLRVCVICKGDVAACQAAGGGQRPARPGSQRPERYNIIPSPAEEPDSLMDMLEDIKRKGRPQAAKLARMAAAKGEAAAPAAEESPRARPRSSRFA